MSDAAQGGGTVGAPAVSPNTRGDVGATNMPSVPEGAGRKSLSDFNKARRTGDLPARADASRQAPAKQAFQRQTPTSAADWQQSHPQLGIGLNDEARQLASPTNPRTLAEGAEPAAAPAPADPGSEPELDAQGLPQDPANDQGAEEQQEAAPGTLSDAEIIAKFREWEQSDLAPEEIFADKLHPVKVRGQERYVDYNELRQGYMRQADYTQRGQELKQKETQVEGYRKSIEEHFSSVKDPEQFLEIYERNGYSDVLEKVAERIQSRNAEHRSLVIAAGRAAAERLGFSVQDIKAGHADNHRDVIAAMQSTDQRLRQTRAIEIENRKLAYEKQKFEAERQAATHQQEVQKHQQTYDRQLNQLRPGAFKANGIQDNQGNRIAFLRHLGDVINLEGLSPEGITRAQVMAAARSMREELEDRMQQERGNPGQGFMSPQEYRAKQQAEARRAALGPNRVATGAGKPLQAQRATGRSVSDFARQKRAGLLGK